MRFSIVAICLAVAGCARAPPPPDYTQMFQKDLEDQLGITRAKQRQELCSRLPAPAIGMKSDQVRSSCWGQPDHAAESVTAQGKQAVWSYPEGYVYLSDGVVTKIITSR
jgi:hypothetical protein